MSKDQNLGKQRFNSLHTTHSVEQKRATSNHKIYSFDSHGSNFSFMQQETHENSFECEKHNQKFVYLVNMALNFFKNSSFGDILSSKSL